MREITANMRYMMKYGIVIIILGLILGCGEEDSPESSVEESPMVLIPAGEFKMGTDTAEIPELVQWHRELRPDWNTNWAEQIEDETPRHTVYLDAFYIDVYEVTNSQYGEFMKATGHAAPAYWDESLHNAPEQPVVGVTWHDAIAYAEWADKRLPTEAEWEKAARGGLVGKHFPWGDEISSEDADYYLIEDGASPVGSFAPNGYGLYDMAGNASEWCFDWYDKGYYKNSPVNNPPGPDSGSTRIIRGASWFTFDFGLRTASRSSWEPTKQNFDIGFRCAKDADQ